jgi:hypothetical protein
VDAAALERSKSRGVAPRAVRVLPRCLARCRPAGAAVVGVAVVARRSMSTYCRGGGRSRSRPAAPAATVGAGSLAAERDARISRQAPPWARHRTADEHDE